MKALNKDSSEHILLLTPTGRDSIVASSVLQRAGLHTCVCHDLNELCNYLKEGAGAILVSEEALSAEAAPQLADLLLQQPAWSDIPIVVLTISGQSPQITARAVEMFQPAGNVTLLERPFHAYTLVSSMNVALRARRKQYEVRDLLRTLESSLKEKEALLQEVHHRVKNNLQVISSLLSLQARQISDPSALGAFNDSTGRVKAMALVHEKLYGTPNLSRVDFQSYADSLISELFRSYNRSSAAITRSVECDQWEVDANKAVPLGLILNELISNSLKYAFPEPCRGEIRIRLHCKQDEPYVQLTISDNGVGLPDDLVIGKGATLGLRLVKILSDQMDAEMHIERNHGTTFSFKLRAYTN